VEVTVLGAGTAVPSPGRSAAGVLVRIGGVPLLFDLGPGTVARMAEAGTSHRDLEHVFLTHLHSDHTLDLVTLLQANNATPGWTRSKPLRLTGCYGTRRLYDSLLAAYPDVSPKSYPLEIRECGPERIRADGWTIETALTGHTGSSLAYRVEAGSAVFVYSGDCVESDDLKRLARGADLFVCECAFPRGWPTVDHMTAEAVGRVAQTAQVKRVILTHLYPPAQSVDLAAQVHETYKGQVIVAVDGIRTEV
jgi:ribonuclease BN (tRNA processing enzyme)